MDGPTERNLPAEFEAVSKRIRSIRVVDETVILARLLLLTASISIVADALMRFPALIRWAIFLALVWWAVWLLRRRVLPAARGRRSAVNLALEIEGEIPQASGRLASGVEFAQDGTSATSPLARQVMERAVTLVEPQRIAGLAKTGRLRRNAMELGVVALVWVVLLAFIPSFVEVGFLRTLAPWMQIEWPARTGVRSTTFATHHPKRTSLALRADLFKGDPLEEPVWVRMRLTRDGVTGPWDEQQLMHQGETRFERLVDPGADSIEFLFLTRDVETAPQQIEFVEAPHVASAIATVTPPQYASAIERQRIDLGDATGSQGRIAQPILAGSLVEIAITTIPPLSPGPAQDGSRKEWEAATFKWESAAAGGDQPPPDFALGGERGAWTLTWTADKQRVLALRLTDENGVRNVEDIRVSMEVVSDTPAEALMVEPATDETVLPTAEISLQGQARDDVGVASLTLEATKGAQWRQVLAEASGPAQREMTVATTLDLAALGAKPGDLFEIAALATDGFIVDGSARAATRSTPRRLRVLTRAQFEEETRSTLSAVRQGALRVDERQRTLVAHNEAASAQVRPQTEIGERLAVLRKQIAALQQRIERNRVNDSAMQSLLSAASDILESAGEQSNEARDELQRAAQAQDGPATQSTKDDVDEGMKRASGAQAQVSAELKDLADLLEHDKDAWVASRRLEKLAEAIQKASDERSKAGARTLGRSQSDLGADEMAALERAADSAAQAGQAASEVMEDLRERSDQVRKEDPARAANLQEAAKRGENEALTARMEQAAQATRQNKLDEARAATQEAMQTVQRMIEDLADDEKKRSETLRRRLASLAESLEQLVRQAASAEAEATALLNASGAEVASAAPVVSREAATISLNAGGVADDARAAGPSTQRVVRLLERAAEAEGRAAASLGAAPAQVSPGHEQLSRGRALLEEALGVLRQQEERTEEAERQERAMRLAQEYKAICDRQEGVLAATTAMVGAQSNRRSLVEARRLGVEQEQVAAAIEAVAAASEDVRKSGTFMEATGFALDAAGSAAQELRSGIPTEGTVLYQREVLETLRGLANALGQAARKEESPFAQDDAGGEGSGGGGGGGGGGQDDPLIAPLAEVKMLRALQQRIYERTKLLPAGDQGGDPARALARRQESIAALAQALRDEVERKAMQGGAAPKVESQDPKDGDQEP